MLIITHDLVVVEYICDRIAVMYIDLALGVMLSAILFNLILILNIS